MQKAIEKFVSDRGKSIAYGGYLEKRSLYQRSSHFQAGQQERNIHLGIDFWCEVHRGVCCPFDGVVHSFQINDHFGDYGPTIILEHTIHNEKFYALYGHLSRDSLTDKETGQRITKGDVFARVGDKDVNGHYAPHLHFQIIRDIQDYRGDYPGVCSSSELDYYKKNCPNPAKFIGFE